MNPQEYLMYFEDLIFIADKESGLKNPFAEGSVLFLLPSLRPPCQKEPCGQTLKSFCLTQAW